VRYKTDSKYFWVLISFFLKFNLSAWAQPVFITQASDSEVGLEESFEVKFVLQNAEGYNFAPPSFSDFIVLSGPNKMNSVRIEDGISNTSEVYSFILQGKKLGNFTLEPARIVVKGRMFSSNSVKITVGKGQKQTFSGNQIPTDKPVFVHVLTSTQRAYVGQQIVLDFNFYTRLNVNGFKTLREPSYEGFSYLSINDFSRYEKRITLGGKTYISKTLSRIGIFPQREGLISLEPLELEVGVVKNRKEDASDPIFGPLISEVATVRTERLVFDIQPLPAAPAGFTGAVGSFSMTAEMPQTRTTTDIALQLKLKISGNGDSKSWLPPKIVLPDSLATVYDPKLIGEPKDFEQQGEWVTIKEYEYLILPKKMGNFTLKPAFIYFQVDENTTANGGKYQTLTPDSFDIFIAQGKSQSAALATQTTDTRDILGIKSQADFQQSLRMFWGSAAFWALAALPLIFMAMALVLKQQKLRKARANPVQVRQEKAYEMATKSLDTAQNLIQNGNARGFYDLISKTLYKYLSDSLGLETAAFSQSGVENHLKARAFPDTEIQPILQILTRAERAIFAGETSENTMQDTLRAMRTILQNIDLKKQEIRKEAPKKD
jgi:hypothetical protein